jgi:hypothetical protein
MDTEGSQRESALRRELSDPASGGRSLWAAPSLVASRSTATTICSAAVLRSLLVLTVLLPNPSRTLRSYPIHPEGRAAQTIANPSSDAKRGSLLAVHDVACCATGKNGSLRR